MPRCQLDLSPTSSLGDSGSLIEACLNKDRHQDDLPSWLNEEGRLGYKSDCLETNSVAMGRTIRARHEEEECLVKSGFQVQPPEAEYRNPSTRRRNGSPNHPTIGQRSQTKQGSHQIENHSPRAESPVGHEEEP
jgi:hypothetical protein